MVGIRKEPRREGEKEKSKGKRKELGEKGNMEGKKEEQESIEK